MIGGADRRDRHINRTGGVKIRMGGGAIPDRTQSQPYQISIYRSINREPH